MRPTIESSILLATKSGLAWGGAIPKLLELSRSSFDIQLLGAESYTEGVLFGGFSEELSGSIHAAATYDTQLSITLIRWQEEKSILMNSMGWTPFWLNHIGRDVQA